MRSNKRQTIRAIDESFQDSLDNVEQPEYGYIVEAFLEDGDKWWLDGWHVVGIFDTLEECQECADSYRESTWEYRELQDWELRPSIYNEVHFTTPF